MVLLNSKSNPYKIILQIDPLVIVWDGKLIDCIEMLLALTQAAQAQYES